MTIIMIIMMVEWVKKILHQLLVVQRVGAVIGEGNLDLFELSTHCHP